MHLYMGGERKSKMPEHVTFPNDRLCQILLTSPLFTVSQKSMLPLAPIFTHITLLTLHHILLTLK